MKIAVLVSGGVDSSVALQLLKEQGHDLTAFYLKIWLEDELSYLGNCPWEEDLDYAQKVCDKLQVPLEVIPMQQEYHDKIVAYTIKEVQAGRTPSPDVLCNQYIKFGCFYDKIDSLKPGAFEKVASGHYAQVEQQDDLFVLKKAKDPVKDQTYFLARLSQKQLCRVLFPIGHLLKSEVRVLAEKFDLPTKSRKDSQGICFLGKIKFSDFIKHHLKERQGNLVEFETGIVVGKHEGFWYYTVGQRKGIGLSGGPWFVVKKDTDKNIVYISKNYYSDDKSRDTFTVCDFNWIAQHSPEKRDLEVKLRHGEVLYKATLDLLGPKSGFFSEHGASHGDGSTSSPRARLLKGARPEPVEGCEFQSAITTGIVKIEGNDQGIAPGQFAVFYDGDICLGCAVICS
ncbi:MAG: tRNA 2-thiouridine(34) synthase MnmA [bacterium]